MSSEHSNANSSHDANVLDTWWPLLVILFGVIFFAILASWKPGDQGSNEPAVKPAPVAGTPVR